MRPRRIVAGALAGALAWAPAAFAQDAGSDDAVDPATFALELTQRGGFVAEQELLSLARRPDSATRLTALRGIKAIALCCTQGLDGVHDALNDPDADVRIAAYEALAWVGSASDLPALIEGLASGDERTRRAAGHALEVLTAVELPSSERTCWIEWWNEASATLPAELDATLRRLERGHDASELDDARRCLTQLAWIDVGRV